MKHNTTILIAHWRSEDCYVPFLSDVRGKEQNRHTWGVWLIHFLLCCIMLGHSVIPAWVPCECCIGKKTAVASQMCPGHVYGNPANFSLWFFEADNCSYKQELKCVGSSVWNCGISKTIIGVIYSVFENGNNHTVMSGLGQKAKEDRYLISFCPYSMPCQLDNALCKRSTMGDLWMYMLKNE